MKKRYFLPVVLLVALNSINAQKTYVPDDNFEDYLIFKGYDSGTRDDSVLTANISVVPRLDIPNENISNLTGIQDFVGLQILHCENNQLTSLNMTGVTALRELYCGNNLLTELIVYQNSALTLLSCFGNKLTTLDVRQNDKLTTLVCSSNLIVNLRVTGAEALRILLCENNQIVHLDLSDNIALTTLNCTNNKLTIVNVHNGHNELITSFSAINNAALTCIEVDDADNANNKLSPYTSWSKPASAIYSEACILPATWVPDVNFELALQERGYDAGPLNHYVYTHEIAMVYNLDVRDEGITDLTGIGDFQNLGHLDCSHNDIINLDLSRNSGLIDLKCNNNQLVTLNVRNGHNTLITTFNATGNPALTCIEVDDEIKAITGVAPYNVWQKDATAQYSANCSLFGIKTDVPDERFEQALITLGYDLAPTDGEVSASLISRVTTLVITSKLIQDLTGIEGFTDLTSLNCANNQLVSLDVSHNIALKSLLCYSNQLTTLDLSHNTALEVLNCNNNLFGSLNISNNTHLRELNCQNNQIKVLDVSNNASLVNLYCQSNLLESLDLTKNVLLKIVDCYNNQIPGLLDLSNNTVLSNLDCHNNLLTNLVAGGGAMTNLKYYDNGLTSLDVRNNRFLSQLQCQNNKLASLDLSTNPKIWLLRCGNNNLTSLDVSTITELVDFDCRNNQLTSLNVSNNLLLGGLWCCNNQIPELKLDNNPNLLTLVCYSNQIKSLVLSGNTKLSNLMCSSNQITSLDLTNNCRLKQIIVHDNPLTELILPPPTCAKAVESGQTNESQFDITASNKTLLSLNISKTALTSIDVLNFANLDTLLVQSSKLDSLDVSGNVVLRCLNTTGTPLKCIQVNQNQLNSIPAGWIKDAAASYSVNCKSSTFIEDEILSESIILYPNPAGDVLTIESVIPLIRVEIYSVTGIKIMDIQSDFDAIPVKSLSKGVYMLKIETEYGCATKKFARK